MEPGDTTVLEGSSARSEDAFQRLLLKFSAAAAQGMDAPSLIRLFCTATREFFQVDGVYFWQVASKDELVGAEADGLMAEGFRGTPLKASESAVAAEAARSRKTVFVNGVDSRRYHLAAEFHAKSLMSVPLIVSNEVVGAAVFLHVTEETFSDDDAAKATILAGQLGSLLEANRLSQVSREEHRRAEILAEVAQALHSVPDATAVVEAVADRLRVLLRTRLVCILLREGETYNLSAISAETAQMASAVRLRHDRKGLHFASHLAARAVAAGEPILVSIDPASHALGDLVPAGALIAAPFRTSRTQGAVLVYPRHEGVFSAEEKSLVSSVAGFGAVAIANAELYSTAREQAQELHQLLEISSELGSIADLDKFLQRFSLRASDFLGFDRAFIGMIEEDGKFHVHWGADEGKTVVVDLTFPDGAASNALLNAEVFWSDDPEKIPGANLELIKQFSVRQILAVPLLGSDHQVFGMFGVLDHRNQAGVSQEDIRRAKSLATQISVALQVTRNLHLSEQHRRRAGSLMALVLDLNAQVRLPEFAKSFVSRAADMLGAKAAALAMRRDADMELISLQEGGLAASRERSLLSRLAIAFGKALENRPQPTITGEAEELLGADLASEFGWEDCTLVRLVGGTGELLGVLCLADRGKPLVREDQQLLQAISGHASVALENARFFTRMDRANRHWMEIFDAISDFIIVHDESGNVLRVNRSLADFIGISPQELIGVNMCALLAIGNDTPLHSCPFCRTSGADADEFVHPALQRSYLVSTSRVHGASSEGLQTIHVLKDITDRREAERRYRELFDNIQEGIFFSTEDGRFIEVNDAMVRMLGYDNREELLKVDITAELYFNPADRARSARMIEQHGLVRNNEATLRRKDGSPVHVLVNAFAVRDPGGRTLQYRGLMLDISSIRSFQAELQRERDFSSKILNNTQSLILVADTAGLVSYANRRWQEMGYEQRQILGQQLENLVAAPRRHVLSEAYAQTLAGQQVDNLELQILRGDGRVGQFSVNLSPMRDEQGGVTSIVVVMSDITDAASLQAKLMHAEKLAAVGQLVSGVAHEVNNPLTAILGFADLLMDNTEVPESARKDLRVILQEAQRTKQIVQNLLSFARQMPPQRKPVQLNVILRRTVQLRAYDFHSHGVEVIEQLDQELPHVVGDSHQLQQVFLNILNNAYDAVRESGRPARIGIMTARLGGFVEVSFRDNGAGITSPDRIFDPFFTTKEVGKGTGLGLSICYGIVREHGGEILCHNNTDGQGATFVVRLPAITEPTSIGVAAGVPQR
jgi:two-component system NtrC family sensor kinase